MKNNIKQLRRAAGLTQKELAGMLGISNVTLSNWETETKIPLLQNVVELAGLLGVTLDDIYPMKKGEGPHAERT